MIFKHIGYGAKIALGGSFKEINDLHYSVYNWNGTDSFLLELSDDFFYFLVEWERYYFARVQAFCNNWEMFWPDNNKKQIGGVFNLACEKALNEFNSFKSEEFLKNYSVPGDVFYSVGELDQNLDKINSIYKNSFIEMKKLTI